MNGKNAMNKFIKRIFSIKQENGHRIFNFFGFKLKIKSADAKLGKIVRNIQVNNMALKIHSEIFPKYRGIYRGRDIVIVGCGPSVKDYNLDIKGEPIYISVNRAFEISEIKFDYIFYQDKTIGAFEEIASYEGNNCKKFQAIITKPNSDYLIPQDATTLVNPLRYVLAPDDNLPYDIAYEPFADLKGTIFSALQFALYTNPRRIYLVGFDCTNTNCFTNYPSDYTYQYPIYERLKLYAERYYKTTEIISVNPIGLRGLFTDVYTKNFLDKHPELDNNLMYNREVVC